MATFNEVNIAEVRVHIIRKEDTQVFYEAETSTAEGIRVRSVNDNITAALTPEQLAAAEKFAKLAADKAKLKCGIA